MDSKWLKQLEEVYNAVLESPAGERGAVLDKMCGSDADLRREVESLLAFEETPNNLLESPPEALAAEMFSQKDNGTNRSYDWDLIGADESYKRALELDPTNATVISGAATLSRALGRFDDSVTLLRRAIELDPISALLHYNLGLYAGYAGHLDESQTALEKCIELNPKFPLVYQSLGLVLLYKGNQDSALIQIMKEPEPDWQAQGLAVLYHALGRKKDSDIQLSKLIDGYQNESAFQIAEVYGYRGETDKAFEWLERAYNQRDSGLIAINGDPLLRNIEKDPRYAVLLEKLKLPL
jgi:tetratricopeptide (TPR) repeat protein